jgi:CheY-like chemotaxis protein/DNA-binding XRE family transcriptional regulator
MSSEFVQWLKKEWDGLEQRTRQKYSVRKLSLAAGLSAGTLHQLLKRPDVQPSPKTCNKLAAFFETDPRHVLQLAGHIVPAEGETTSHLQVATQRSDLRALIYDLVEFTSDEVRIVQQTVDQLKTRRKMQQAASKVAVALVVDDTPSARETIADMLRVAGLKVLEAPHGLAAVELIKTSGSIVDVVLMDYRMPRMDGVEATKQIRERFPDLPVIFVSAWDKPEMKEAAFAVGAMEYLVAPIDYDRLLETIASIRPNESQSAHIQL